LQTKKFKKIALGFVAAGICLALLISGAVPSHAAPMVKIGIRSDFTGPIASTGLMFAYGYIDYPKYINERGGVNGILVETKWIDHRATSSRAIIGHKRLKEAGCILEMDCISTCIEATLSSIQRDEVPMLVTCAFSPAMFTEPIRWVFSMIPGFDSDFATFIWINSQVAAEAIRLAVERVGFENLTGRSVRDALASMNDFDTGLIPPITMSEDKPYYAKVRVYQVQKGKMVPLSDWLEWAYFLEF